MRHTNETPTPHHRHRATENGTQQSPHTQLTTNTKNKSGAG
jgi:hypothetical protein